MIELTELQRRILTELEEAGEDHFSAMTNTVAKHHGALSEIAAMRAALHGLLEAGYVEVRRYRDLKMMERPFPLRRTDAVSLLGELETLVTWSSDNQRWEWRKDVPMADIWLTDSGCKMSDQILLEDGYPDEPLYDYGQ